MKAVGALGTISYGLSMILTILLIVLFGIAPAAIGVKMFIEGTRQGVLLILIGALITYAGTLGLLYKVIADAVATGNKAAPAEDFSDIESYLHEILEKLDESTGETREE